MRALGLDVGGSGIKGAPVDTATGELLDDVKRLDTPRPSTPEAVIETAHEILRHFRWRGRVGCGFPAVVRHGTVLTASHIHDSWRGVPVEERLARRFGRVVRVINDADAAALAEMRLGAGRGETGVVLMVTIGTGVGTSLFSGGRLVPNLELGQIHVRGRRGQRLISDRVRRRKDLSWKEWARRLDDFLEEISAMLWPDLILLGGGVTKRADRFLPRLRVNAKVAVAAHLNQAGIVGAALAADPRREAG